MSTHSRTVILVFITLVLSCTMALYYDNVVLQFIGSYCIIYWWRPHVTAAIRRHDQLLYQLLASRVVLYSIKLVFSVTLLCSVYFDWLPPYAELPRGFIEYMLLWSCWLPHLSVLVENFFKIFSKKA